MRFHFPLRSHATGLALLLLWLTILCTPARATVVLDSPRFDLSILPLVSYFEDEDSLFEPASFQDPALIQQFTPVRGNILRFGFTRSTLWLRVQLDNRQSVTRSAMLYLTRPSLGLMRVYQLTAQGPRLLGTAGSMTPKVFADLPYRAPLVTLPLTETGLHEYLIEVRSDHFISFALHLSDPARFYLTQFHEFLLAGVLAGILIVLVLQGLAIALRHRDACAFQFSLFALGTLLFLQSASGYLGYLWPPLPGLQTRFDASALMLLCTASVQFVRILLDTASSRPRLNQALHLASGLLLLILLAGPALSPHLHIQIALAASLAAVPLTLYAVAIRHADGYRLARFMLPSRILILLVGLINVQAVYFQLAMQVEGTWLMLAALFIDALMARWALGQRQKLQIAAINQQRQRIAVQEAERHARNEFLGQISHEIRTPMNGILGMAELLEDSPLSPTQEDFVHTIRTSGNHLLKILDDILDYSKIETGKLALDVTSFDLGLMLGECVEMFKPRAREKKLELITHVHSDVPTQVKGDATRVRQVLANLVSNAIKFTDQGEVSIEISRHPESSPRHVRFTVSDTGVGMGREQLQHLFSPPDAQTDPLPHPGLGLSISRQLVRMMHGDIGARSQLNKGSTFWFSIPLEPDADTQDQPLVAEQLQGLRLLVVDDNASCRLVLQQQASSWGMNVADALNGKQALAMLHNQATLHEPFDIVILDHEMPGMTGMELAARIKEDPLIQNDPLVLMLTGLGMAPSSLAARNAGIRRVITKPVTGRMLKQTLLEELAHLRRIQAEHRPADQSTELPALNILVAEDHHLSQKVIKGMLARLGARAWTVDNGQRVLELIKQQPFDLVLMDCEMPVMNGFDAASAIRQWEKAENRPPIPIIALTAHIMDEHRQRSLQCGMNAHLSKPIELGELRDVLLQWAGNGGSQPTPLGRKTAG